MLWEKLDKRLIFFGGEPYHLVEQIPQEGEVMPDFLLWQFHNGIGQSVSRDDLIQQETPALFCCMHSQIFSKFSVLLFGEEKKP